MTEPHVVEGLFSGEPIELPDDPLRDKMAKIHNDTSWLNSEEVKDDDTERSP